MPKRGKRGRQERAGLTLAESENEEDDDLPVGPAVAMNLDVASTDDESAESAEGENDSADLESDEDESDSDSDEMDLKATRLNDSSDEEDDDEEEDEDRSLAINTAWGRHASQYYSGDTADLEIGQDFSEALEEEKLAIATQRAQRAQESEMDYMLDLVEVKDNSQVNKKRPYNKISTMKGSIEVLGEELDLSTLSSNEQLMHIRSEAPETFGLLEELNGYISELQWLRSCIEWCQSNQSSVTDEGITYLELRRHLLTSFATNVNFFLLLQKQGISQAREHPVMDHLLKVRRAIVRLKPLDRLAKKDRKLMEKFAKDAQSPSCSSVLKKEGSRAEIKERADIEEKEESEEDSEEETAEKTMKNEKASDDKILKYIDQEEISFARKLRKSSGRLAKEGKRRMYAELSSDVGDVASYAGEFADAAASKLQVSLNSMTQKQRSRSKKTLGGDEYVAVAEPPPRRTDILLKAPWEEDINGPEDPDGLDTFENYQNGNISAIESKSIRDAKTIIKEGNDDGDYYDNDDGGDGDTTAFYREMAAFRDAKKKARSDKYTVPKRIAGAHNSADLPSGKKRGATYQIMKNRGLVAQKAKINRNPRVKKKEQYRKKVIARKGQVRDIRDSAEGAHYAGEATGIKVNVARGRRIMN